MREVGAARVREAAWSPSMPGPSQATGKVLSDMIPGTEESGD